MTTRIPLVRALVTCVALSLAAACGQADASDPLASSDLPVFAVSDTPSVTLADDGTEEKLFSRVTARRMSDGMVVVGDQGSTTIRVFGRDGNLVRTIARRGRGPGELPGTFRLVAVGDTILALGQPPMSPADVHVFTESGYVSRSHPTTDSARRLTGVDGLSTGELLVRRGIAAKVLMEPPEPGILIADSVSYGAYSAGVGEGRAEVMWLPPVVRAWMITFPWPGGPIPTSMSEFPLGPTTTVLASDDRVWVVQGDSGRVRALNGAGKELVSAIISVQPRPFDRGQLEDMHRAMLAAASRALDTARVEATYDEDVLPPFMPVVSSAYAGADGGVWLQLFDLDGSAPQQFIILSRDAREIGRATLPAGLNVQQIGEDFVLGVMRDSLGVESVVEYAITPP